MEHRPHQRVNADLPRADDQIDAVCQQFESAWCSDTGSSPQIEDFLSAASDDERPLLLRALLSKELELLRREGAAIVGEAYESRFQQDVETVREVLSTFQRIPAGEPPTTIASAQRPEALHECEPTEALERTSTPDAHPTRVGRYEILGEVARGGMGCVLRAYDPLFDRHLAIKIGFAKPQTDLDAGSPTADPTDSARTRFLHEAQITGKLQHPGVPPVHDCGDLDDGQPFFAMKLVDGQTFGELLRQRNTTEDRTRNLTIFGQICETVAYAHSRNIVHRDLKPANIMVGEFGEVQVMDWGLAKTLESTDEIPSTNSEAGDLSSSREFQTLAGTIMGTPAYMAPEQARGEIDKIDKRTDVFGLGAILCEVLSGHPPYTASSRGDVLQAAMQGDWSTSRQALEALQTDTQLANLVTSCLAIHPQDRPADAAEVNAAIRLYLESVRERLRQADLDRASSEAKYEEERKRGQVERQRNRLQLTLMVVAVCALVAAVVGLVWYQRVRASQIADDVRQEQQRLARRDRISSEVSAALDAAESAHSELLEGLADYRRASRLVSDIDGWESQVVSARTAVTRAEKIADADRSLLPDDLVARLSAVGEKVAQDERNYRLGRRFDNIRVASSAKRDPFETMAAYEEAMLEFGLDISKATPATIEAAAQQVASSDIRYPLVAAIDHWNHVCRGVPLGEPGTAHQKKMVHWIAKLSRIATSADPNEWRLVLRYPGLWFNREKKVAARLASEVNVEEQSPQILCFLASMMQNFGLDPKPLLHSAMFQHPQDFWLCNEMARLSTGSEQALAFRNLTAIRPNSAVAWNNLGVALHNIDDTQNAERAYHRAAELDPTYAAPYTNFGSLYVEQQRFEDAIRAFRKAIELDEDNFYSLNNLANMLRREGKLEEAAKAHQQALKFSRLAPDANSPLIHVRVRNSRILFQLAITEFARKRYAEALEAFQKADRIVPDQADTLTEIARCFDALNKPTEARLAVDRALQVVTDSAPAWQLSARLYEKAPGGPELEQAESAYRRWCELQPKSAEAWAGLGGNLLQQGRHEEAITAIRKSLKINETSANAWRRLAEALSGAGQADEAKAALEKAKLNETGESAPRDK